MLVQNNYEKLNNNNTDLLNLLEVQKSEIKNCSSMIESYYTQLLNFIKATKEGYSV